MTKEEKAEIYKRVELSLQAVKIVLEDIEKRLTVLERDLENRDTYQMEQNERN